MNGITANGQPVDWVPGKGWRKVCENLRCPKPAREFWSVKSHARFCCDACRSASYYQNHQRERNEQSTIARAIKRNDQILAQIYQKFHSNPVPMAMLEFLNFDRNAHSLPARSQNSGRKGELFIHYVLCYETGGAFFRVYPKGEAYDRS